MALAYLIDPQNQFMTKSGTINVGGVLRVYDAATDDTAVTYCDFGGTENEEAIVLDNNGRAIVIADSDKAYRVEVYDRYGSLMWTTTPIWCMAGGGGVMLNVTEVISSDGSIAVDKTKVGSTTTYDLSTHVQDGDDLIEAIRCDGAEVVQGTDIYRPIYTAGTMEVGNKGLVLLAGRYYHVTAHVKATKSVQRDPFYDEVNIRLIIDDGETQTDSVVSKRIVDYSLGLSQEFEVSTDVIPATDCELLLVIDGHDVQNGSFELLDLEAHRVYSGAPYIPSGVLSRVQAADIYQEKLIAGDNITIEGNVISATGDFEQVQSDWTETDTTADSFIRHKPQTKPVVAGQNIVIDETSTQFVISATAEPQQQADWDEDDTSSVQYIQNKPDLSVYATTQAMNTALAGKQDTISDLATIRSGAALGATATQPSDLAAGLATKQDTLTAGSNITIQNNVISATAEPQQQADWDEADTSSVQYIQNKPDLSVYATGSELSAGLATKQDVISDLATIRSGAAEGSTAVQPADLAPYATTSDMNTALASKQDTLTAGSNITIQNNVISATADPQVQADWAQTDSSEVDFIKNKPDLSVYATTSAMNTALAGKQDVISDLSDIRAGAALGDTAVQPTDLATVAESGNYEDLNNKPDLSIYAESANLATVATTGSYADLTNTPSIPTATSDLTNDSGFITLSDVPAQVQADWNESDSSDPSYIQNKPANLVQDASYVHTDENFTSAEKTKLAGIAAGAEVNVQADWTEADSSSDAYIANKPANIVQDASYVHTDENFTSAEKTKLAGIAAGAQVNVQSDWAETDNSSDAYIANKPDLSVYATDAELSAGLATKQDTISDLTAIRSGAAAGATAVQPSSLATVATTGSYQDLSNKPAIPIVNLNYDAESTNAQSGRAVAQAIAAIPPYTAGDAIEINSNEISVAYDDDTLEVQQQPPVTHTYDVNSVNSGLYGTYGVTPPDIVNQLRTVSVTVHIPANTFYSWYTGGQDAVVLFKTNASDYARSSTYCATPLSYTQDQSTSKYWLDEQDVVITTLVGNDTCNYFSFGLLYYGTDLSNDTWQFDTPTLANPVQFSYTSASGAAALAVKNPLPASTSSDASKVLTVDAQGTPAWASAQSPISAGTGIDITNNVVSVDTSVVATKTDLASKQDNLTAGTNVQITNNVISATDTTYSAGNGIDITNNVISVDTTVVATQTDLADKEDAFDVGTGLEMDTSGATPTLQVETPVDIVAGPGIHIDNPDGNTLRVSQAANYEVALWANSSGSNASAGISLSESPYNFDKLSIQFGDNNGNVSIQEIPMESSPTQFTLLVSHINNAATNVYLKNGRYSLSSSTLTRVSESQITFNGNTVSTVLATDNLKIYRVVGIHRINGGN